MLNEYQEIGQTAVDAYICDGVRTPIGKFGGARLVLGAAHELKRCGGRYALCTMCVGVGQGTALILERV